MSRDSQFNYESAEASSLMTFGFASPTFTSATVSTHTSNGLTGLPAIDRFIAE
jgi:hypothetical protein